MALMPEGESVQVAAVGRCGVVGISPPLGLRDRGISTPARGMIVIADRDQLGAAPAPATRSCEPCERDRRCRIRRPRTWPRVNRLDDRPLRSTSTVVRGRNACRTRRDRRRAYDWERPSGSYVAILMSGSSAVGHARRRGGQTLTTTSRDPHSSFTATLTRTLRDSVERVRGGSTHGPDGQGVRLGR